VAVALGLLVSLLIILLTEYSDGSVSTPERLGQAVGLATLAVVGELTAAAKARPLASIRAAPDESTEELTARNRTACDPSETEAYQVLVDDHGLTQEQIAERVGKDRSSVANALRLLKLPADVRDLVRDGRLDMGHARALLGVEGADQIRKLAQRAVREGLSVRATEALVRLLGIKGRKKPQAPSETPGIRALAQRLQRRLGAKVRVVPKSGVAGRLEVEYTSLDELDGILAKIGA
jgi:ParB-like chromosome segregation protein Spo0J